MAIRDLPVKEKMFISLPSIKPEAPYGLHQLEAIIPEEAEGLSTIQHSSQSDFEHKITEEEEINFGKQVFCHTQKKSRVSTETFGDLGLEKGLISQGIMPSQVSLMGHTPTARGSNNSYNIIPAESGKSIRSKGKRMTRKVLHLKIAKESIKNLPKEIRNLDFTPKTETHFKVGELTNFLNQGYVDKVENKCFGSRKPGEASLTPDGVMERVAGKMVIGESEDEEESGAMTGENPENPEEVAKNGEIDDDAINFSFQNTQDAIENQGDDGDSSEEGSNGGGEEPMDLKIFKLNEEIAAANEKKIILPVLNGREIVHRDLRARNKRQQKIWQQFEDKTKLLDFEITKTNYRFLPGYKVSRSPDFIKKTVTKQDKLDKSPFLATGIFGSSSNLDHWEQYAKYEEPRFSNTVKDQVDLPIEVKR